MPLGKSSKPDKLRTVYLKTSPSTTIAWDRPIYSGGMEIFIQKYIIKIPDIDYSEEESGTVYTHNIVSADLMFNKLYDVEVSAINTCSIESDPANISVNIEANSKF